MNKSWSLLFVAGCLIAGCSEHQQQLSSGAPDSKEPITAKTEATSAEAPATEAPASKEITPPATSVKVAAVNADLMGTWKGEIQQAPSTKEEKDNPMAGMAKQFAKMMTGNLKLEFKPGNAFVLNMMVPLEGTFTRTGNKLTLKPEKVMGMTPEEASKMSDKGPMSMTAKEPIKAVVSADGKTITLSDDKGNLGGSIVFQRASMKVVKATVSSDENKYVGEYKGVVTPPADQSTPAKQKAAQMMERMKDAFSLELRADNTYTMNMIMAIDGKWKLSNGKIKLTMEGLEGMAKAFGGANGAENSGMPNTLTPAADGSLKLDDPHPERGTLAFKRK